jgi:predicted KAP-like P-loop ATPase
MSNQKPRPPVEISADSPGSDPNSDRLGYAPFAKRLAQSIAGLERAEGHVLALYGRWGFGKTTMLNYVRHYLNEIAEKNRPVALSFNPWWFSGHEDLVRAFFAQLSAKIGDHKEFPSDVRKRLADLADSLADVPLPYVGGLAKVAGKMIRPKVKDVEKLKIEISALLRSQRRRILIMIDDIDRLTSEEIRQVFRAVKSVGDFPNVTYLLAFDKQVVVRSLGELQGGSGEDYLEKIVQVPFELPHVDRVSIRGLFFERVDSIIAGVDSKNFDQTYWGNVFLEGIDKFLESPRDVVRFTNAVAVTFPAVASEVNPVDFIAVESLRIFAPEVYEAIRSNREMFAGNGAIGRHGEGREVLVEFHNAWLRDVGERTPTLEEPIKNMLARLFPKLQGVWENMQFGPEWEAEWRLASRVCSDTIFPIYFSLAVPTGEISKAEIKEILGNAANSRMFERHLLKLADETRPDGKSRAHAFLVRIQDYTAREISTEQIGPIVVALLDVGDQLMRPADQGSSLFDLGIDVQCGRVIWQLLKRLDAPRSFELLRDAFTSGRALYLIQKEFIVLAQQQGFYGEQGHPEREWLITREQLEQLKGILIDRISRASKDGSLLHSPRMLLLLNFWAEKDASSVQTWFMETIKEDAKLAELLEHSIQTTASAQWGDVVARRHDRLDPKWFQKLVDIEGLVIRVRELSKDSSLSEIQERAVREFLREYEIRRRGGNPDDPFAQEES